MDVATRSRLVLGSLLCATYLFTWFVLSHFLFNSDVSWLLEASRRLLAGGTYSHDFFEVNPPLILYLLSPVALAIKLFALPTYTALYLYIYSLTTLSLLFCSSITRQIFSLQDTRLRGFFIIMLAMIFLLLPLGSFGQREQLLLIFTVPYFLWVALRIQHPAIERTAFAIGVGIFAAFGFALKPFFLFSLVITELYYCYKVRRALAWWRPETIAIGSVIALYLLCVVAFQRDYLFVIIPHIAQLYYQRYCAPFTSLFQDNVLYFTAYTLMFCWIGRRFNRYPSLTTVLTLATLGFLFSYLVGHTHWFYHAYPIFALDLLLCGFLFQSLILQKTLTRRDYLSLSALGGVIILFLIWRVPYIWVLLTFYSATYFCGIAALFACLFAVAFRQHTLLKTVTALSICLSIGMLFSGCCAHTTLMEHNFALTTLLLFLLYMILIPNNTTRTKLQFGFFGIIGMLIFAYPCQLIGYTYGYSKDTKVYYSPLLKLLQSYPAKQSVIFFTNNGAFAFPTLDYSHQPLAGRFSAMSWALQDLRIGDSDAAYEHAYQQQKSSLDYFIGLVVDDLVERKPDLVFIDRRQSRMSQSHGKLGYFGDEQTDYLKFFARYPRFNQIWKSYHYVKTVDGQPVFKFDIYEKNHSL